MQGLPEQVGGSCGGFCPLHEQTQGDAISARGNMDKSLPKITMLILISTFDIIYFWHRTFFLSFPSARCLPESLFLIKLLLKRRAIPRMGFPTFLHVLDT